MDRTSAANWTDIGGGKRGYRDRNLGAGLAGTALVAADFNAQQEELMGVIEAAGITPLANDWTQLLDALTVLYGGGGTLATTGWQRLAGGLLVEWGTFSVTVGAINAWYSTTVTFPLAFPTECFLVNFLGCSGTVGSGVPGGSTGPDKWAVDSLTAAGFRAFLWDEAETGANALRYLAIGH